jgi:surfeit locus 1 family protein
MLRGYSFRPRGWGLAASAIACVLFISLGNWQSRRAADKRELGANLDRAAQSAPIELPSTTAVVHKRVAARGHFLAERTVFLDNKLRRGRPGYEVVTPLRIGGAHVLVNRGWVAAPASREKLPEVRTPSGEVPIDGIALERLPHALAAGPSSGKVRQNLDIAAYAAETGLRFLPIVIEQRSDSGDGLARDWPRADLGIDKHESYSLQWYSFAVLALALGIIFSFRRISSDGSAS